MLILSPLVLRKHRIRAIGDCFNSLHIFSFLPLILRVQDNKVLPTEVGPTQARAEDHWWYDPNYLISDLNVNSAIAHPAHDEVFSPTPGNDTYTVQGYAYAGGGRRITRVEVTLDDGDTWLLCKIK